MTTFEGILIGIIAGITGFLPLGEGAHLLLVPALFPQLSDPTVAIGAISAGSLLAVLIYFRHDWASMISSMLGVLIFRKYPMTVDERLPIFVAIASIPPAVAWHYVDTDSWHFISSPIASGLSIAGFGIALMLFEGFSRKNKGTFDWNWIDSLVVGVFQILMLIPGCGALTGALCAGLMRNYQRVAATKFALFCAAPLLAVSAFRFLRHPEHLVSSSLSWVTLILLIAVTCLGSLLAIGGLMKQAEKNGFRSYVIYRLTIGIGVTAWLTLKS